MRKQVIQCSSNDEHKRVFDYLRELGEPTYSGLAWGSNWHHIHFNEERKYWQLGRELSPTISFTTFRISYPRDLVGRWVRRKALTEYPECGVKVGNYDHILRNESFGYWLASFNSCTNSGLESDWELMPVGFIPFSDPDTGKWYKYKEHYIKVKSIDHSCINGETINSISKNYASNGAWSKNSDAAKGCALLTDLMDIQPFLPLGHIDKLSVTVTSTPGLGFMSPLDEAKRRYPIGTKIMSPKSDLVYLIDTTEFRMEGRDIRCRTKSNNPYLFFDGKWANIVVSQDAERNERSNIGISMTTASMYPPNTAFGLSPTGKPLPPSQPLTPQDAYPSLDAYQKDSAFPLEKINKQIELLNKTSEEVKIQINYKKSIKI